MISFALPTCFCRSKRYFLTSPLQIEEPPLIAAGVEPVRPIMHAITTAVIALIAIEVYPGTFPEEIGRVFPNSIFDAPISGGLDKKQEIKEELNSTVVDGRTVSSNDFGVQRGVYQRGHRRLYRADST